MLASASAMSGALGGVVLEMAGACWVLPDFYGKLGTDVTLLATFKRQLVGQLVGEAKYEHAAPSSVLRELWAHGGALSNLALKSCTVEAQPAATAADGILRQCLKDTREGLVIAFRPPKERVGLARSLGYTMPPALKAALDDTVGMTFRKRSKFQHSFVLETPSDVWDDAACAPLVAVLSRLRELCEPGAACTWLHGWRPMQTEQHGDLNAANILVDVQNGLWLIDFAKAGPDASFHDAAKMISVLLFEYFPIPFSFDELKSAQREVGVTKLVEGLGMKADAAVKLWERCVASESLTALRAELGVAPGVAVVDEAASNPNEAAEAKLGKGGQGDDTKGLGAELRRAVQQLAEPAEAAARMGEATAIIDLLFASRDAAAGPPELWQIAQCKAPEGWAAPARLVFQLVTQVVELSCELPCPSTDLACPSTDLPCSSTDLFAGDRALLRARRDVQPAAAARRHARPPPRRAAHASAPPCARGAALRRPLCLQEARGVAPRAHVRARAGRGAAEAAVGAECERARAVPHEEPAARRRPAAAAAERASGPPRRQRGPRELARGRCRRGKRPHAHRAALASRRACRRRLGGSAGAFAAAFGAAAAAAATSPGRL